MTVSEISFTIIGSSGIILLHDRSMAIEMMAVTTIQNRVLIQVY